MWHLGSSRRTRARWTVGFRRTGSRCTWRSFGFLARAVSQARRLGVPGIGVLAVLTVLSLSIWSQFQFRPIHLQKTHESVFLQRAYQLIGEADGVISARKLVSTRRHFLAALLRRVGSH